jgi:hypothetical protein
MLVPARLVGAVGIIWFFSLDRNPLVRLEGRLGLSPCPLERYFHVKSAFSGMTEGVYQLVHMNFEASLRANCLSPLAVLACLGIVITGYRPRIRGRRQELVFFSVFTVLSLLVNIVNCG